MIKPSSTSSGSVKWRRISVINAPSNVLGAVASRAATPGPPAPAARAVPASFPRRASHRVPEPFSKGSRVLSPVTGVQCGDVQTDQLFQRKG